MNPPDQDIRARLAAARLPAMPQILLKLLQLCRSDGAGMAEIAGLLANDAGMAVKILQVANSAAYQRSGPKSSLTQALGALGLDLVKTLVINESVLQALGGFGGPGATDMRRFWQHALASAVIARDLARTMDYAQPEEAYLTGLLHDAGRLALLAVAPETSAAHFQAQDSQALCAAEQASLQMSHAQAGAWLVARWGLDSFMADAILYHHEPAQRLQGAHPLIRQVHLAHALAEHDPAQPLAAEAGALCQLEGDAALLLCQGAASQVQRVASLLGIDLSGLAPWSAPTALAPALAPDAAQLRLGEEVRDMALLGEATQALRQAPGQAALLALVRQQAQTHLGLADVAVFAFDAGSQVLRCTAFSEAHQRLAGFVLPLAAGGAMAQAALQQQTGYVGLEGVAPTLAEEQLLRLYLADLLLCVPLVAQGSCLGLLVGALARWQLAELQRRTRFALALGTQAAQAWQAQVQALAPAEASAGNGADARLEAVRQEQRESARRIVHEVNNPLAIIKNYLEVLDDKIARQEPVEGEIGVLHEEIERIGDIMGSYAGTAPRAQPGRTDINQTIRALERLLRQSKFLGPAVELAVRLPAQACEIEGASDTLKQVLLNLVKNSLEVLPQGGRIDIVNNGQVQRNGRFYYAVCVSDTGPGIPAEHRSKLFSPVRSNKPGANRGIGLSIVQGLVRELGGTIACVSTSARGTMFEICLPLSAAQAHTAVARPLQDHV